MLWVLHDMRQDQFNALAELVGLQIDSKATIGAALVLLTGRTQTQAADMLGCRQSTISAAVCKIKKAHRLAKKAA